MNCNIYVAKNIGTDILHSYCAADLRLCFRICKKQVFFMTRLKCLMNGSEVNDTY